MSTSFKVGDTVMVEWGLEGPIKGTVLEVWGDPPTQVRVRIELDKTDASVEPAVLLLPPSTMSAA